MSTAQLACLLLALAAVVAAVAVVLWQRWQQRRLLSCLHKMLDEAIEGDFSQSRYDESMLSAVETRLAQYLAASSVSVENLSSEKEKIKALIADISHQTKTPLSNILLYSQLLAEQPLPPESAACLAALNAQAEKLNFLVDSLVKVSRLEAGVLAVSPRAQPIQPLLDELLEQALPKAAAKDIQLHLDPTPGICACFDRKWTAEALYNLLDNAIKYTPPGGTVHLAATAYEMFVRIDVSDSGIGIPEEEQSKVFGRFYRGAAVRESEGVGIGLYLARQIVSGEGGYLKLRSSPGRGSTFSMFLPREAVGEKNLAKL